MCNQHAPSICTAVQPKQRETISSSAEFHFTRRGSHTTHALMQSRHCYCEKWFCLFSGAMFFSSCTAKVTTVTYNKNVECLSDAPLFNTQESTREHGPRQKSRQALHGAAPSLGFISVSSRPDTKQRDPPPPFRYYSSHPTPFQTLFPTSNTFSDIITFYQRLLTYLIV